MNRLLEIGFEEVGYWEPNGIGIRYILLSHHKSQNLLYSFIVDGEIKYIGKTTNELSKRMYGYQNPGTSQKTNSRIKALIKKQLEVEKFVKIFVLIGSGLLRYGNYEINLAAGLEDCLIKELIPDWNFQGKRLIKVDEKSEVIELAKDYNKVNSFLPKPKTTDIKLQKTYYKKGFINIKIQDTDYIGKDRSKIEIYLGIKSGKTIQGYINRTANKNNTPRILGGVGLREWIQQYFNPNDTLRIDIITPYSIRLHK
jgi:hypothetical protein